MTGVSCNIPTRNSPETRPSHSIASLSIARLRRQDQDAGECRRPVALLRLQGCHGAKRYEPCRWSTLHHGGGGRSRTDCKARSAQIGQNESSSSCSLTAHSPHSTSSVPIISPSSSTRNLQPLKEKPRSDECSGCRSPYATANTHGIKLIKVMRIQLTTKVCKQRMKRYGQPRS